MQVKTFGTTPVIMGSITPLPTSRGLQGSMMLAPQRNTGGSPLLHAPLTSERRGPQISALFSDGILLRGGSPSEVRLKRALANGASLRRDLAEVPVAAAHIQKVQGLNILPERVHTFADLLLTSSPFSAEELSRGIGFVLQDPDQPITPGLVEALRRLGPAAASETPSLLVMASFAAPYLRALSIHALGASAVTTERVLTAMHQGLMDDDPIVVERSIMAFGESAAPASNVLLHMLQNRTIDQENQVRALKAVQTMGPKAANTLPELMRMLRQKDRTTAERFHTIRAIGTFGSQAAPAAEQLACFLSASEPRLVAEAAAALGEIGPAAFASINRALDSRSARRVHGALLAVMHLGSTAKPLLPVIERVVLKMPESRWDAVMESFQEFEKLSPLRSPGQMESEKRIFLAYLRQRMPRQHSMPKSFSPPKEKHVWLSRFLEASHPLQPSDQHELILAEMYGKKLSARSILADLLEIAAQRGKQREAARLALLNIIHEVALREPASTPRGLPLQPDPLKLEVVEENL